MENRESEEGKEVIAMRKGRNSEEERRE